MPTEQQHILNLFYRNTSNFSGRYPPTLRRQNLDPDPSTNLDPDPRH